MNEFKLSIVSGLGIHTGKLGIVRIKGLPEDEMASGPVFNFERFNQRLNGCDLCNLDFRAQKTTVLINKEGEKFLTPEHMLGAVLGYSSLPIEISTSGMEAPGLEGSAKLWLEALEVCAGKEEMEKHLNIQTYPSELDKEFIFEDGAIRIMPADTFKVEYEISSGTIEQSFCFDLGNAGWKDVFLTHIIPARTFITWSDYCRGREKGLLKGAGPDSGILMAETRKEFDAVRDAMELNSGEYPYINRNGFRMENELVKHKILDLLGDLAINGLALPRLNIKVRNGGHYFNHLLLKDLIYERK